MQIEKTNMKITKATVGRGQVVNTGNYESQRFYVELEAEITDLEYDYKGLCAQVEKELERLVKKVYLNTKIDKDTEFGIQAQADEIVHQ